LKTAINIRSKSFKRYFANTSWLMGHRVFSMVVALVVGVYVARYLGPERFGLLSYAGSFVGLFTALATLGLNGIMVRELVKAPGRKDELLGTAFWLKAGGAILMWVGIAAAVPFTHNDTQTNILIVIIAFAVIFQAFNVIDLNYQAEVKSKYVVYAQLVSLVISSITKLVFVWIVAPLVWFAWVFLLDAVVLAIGLTAIYLKTTGKVWYWKWRWQTAKGLLRDSWPLILSGGAIMIQARIDQVMLKEMIGSAEVGQYSVAMRMIEAFGFIPMVIYSSLAPSITNAKKISKTFYRQRLTQLYRLMFLLFLATAIPIYLTAKPVVIFLFGEAYAKAGWLLQLFAIRLFFTNLGVARSLFITNNNLFKYAFAASVIGAISNIIFNYLLIPVYSASGAIIATIISFTLTIFVLDAFYSKTKENFISMINGIWSFWRLLGEGFSEKHN
jgi:O-antigen/teichoic acid export membrane protein